MAKKGEYELCHVKGFVVHLQPGAKPDLGKADGLVNVEGRTITVESGSCSIKKGPGALSGTSGHGLVCSASVDGTDVSFAIRRDAMTEVTDLAGRRIWPKAS
ncbi:MAG: hypothetical protein WCG99_04770 [Candidatus Berkelbacteria bacterium]